MNTNCSHVLHFHSVQLHMYAEVTFLGSHYKHRQEMGDYRSSLLFFVVVVVVKHKKKKKLKDAK